MVGYRNLLIQPRDSLFRARTDYSALFSGSGFRHRHRHLPCRKRLNQVGINCFLKCCFASLFLKAVIFLWFVLDLFDYRVEITVLGLIVLKF